MFVPEENINRARTYGAFTYDVSQRIDPFSGPRCIASQS
jgi:hypothetical protein